jgi:hypothetical protein
VNASLAFTSRIRNRLANPRSNRNGASSASVIAIDKGSSPGAA